MLQLNSCLQRLSTAPAQYGNAGACFVHAIVICQQSSASTGAPQVDPVKGNVAFSSATAGWSFTLQSFAQLYADVYGVAIDARELVSTCSCFSFIFIKGTLLRN